MTMDNVLADLDGFYVVNYFTDLDLPPGSYEYAKGYFVVKDGQLVGLDLGGCTLSGTVAVNSEGDVAHLSVLTDPRTGKPGSLVFLDDGSTGREPVQRNVILKITDVNGKLVLSGTGPIGPGKVSVNAQRVARLGDANF
ncbi:hypothetical protein WCLP8_4000028 [uncultured Gammaproteobacteria bacterium]